MLAHVKRRTPGWPTNQSPAEDEVAVAVAVAAFAEAREAFLLEQAEADQVRCWECGYPMFGLRACPVCSKRDLASAAKFEADRIRGLPLDLGMKCSRCRRDLLASGRCEFCSPAKPEPAVAPPAAPVKCPTCKMTLKRPGGCPYCGASPEEVSGMTTATPESNGDSALKRLVRGERPPYAEADAPRPSPSRLPVVAKSTATAESPKGACPKCERPYGKRTRCYACPGKAKAKVATVATHSPAPVPPPRPTLPVEERERREVAIVAADKPVSPAIVERAKVDRYERAPGLRFVDALGQVTELLSGFDPDTADRLLDMTREMLAMGRPS